MLKTAMPVETQERTPSAVFRALISADVDPGLAHDAAEEVRDRAGENILAAVRASEDRLKTEIQAPQREISTLRRMIGIGFTLLGLCIAIATITQG